ncbi:extensin-like [Ischnura elegans]|uniref:extensin-like n=1 Tax=Ischnura elegans TaxID=197161 RepID=UPI001ED897D8|nr:extensin-like [Ischnura elegans]
MPPTPSSPFGNFAPPSPTPFQRSLSASKGLRIPAYRLPTHPPPSSSSPPPSSFPPRSQWTTLVCDRSVNGLVYGRQREESPFKYHPLPPSPFLPPFRADGSLNQFPPKLHHPPHSQCSLHDG